MAGLNATPSSERVRIGFFGVRNAGKSSVVNAVTGQELSIVSNTLGTTTDPVSKAMELLPVGPVVIVDTPGIDDEGDLGQQRVRRAKRALATCDIGVLVVDGTVGMSEADRQLVAEFKRRRVPFVVVWNKLDALDAGQRVCEPDVACQLLVSAKTGEGISELKELVAGLAAKAEHGRRLIGDLLAEGDVVVLVVPIDGSAPKGRLILPQQMVLRDVLDAHATALVCQPAELAGVLDALVWPPRIVVTDSQAFAEVSAAVAPEVPLTSFSILMARYKGSLSAFAQGAQVLAGLTDESRVLVCEGCTHHRQCEDIGTVKIPKLIRQFAGAEPGFAFTSGNEFPDNLDRYDLIIHCGGCMLNEREVSYRLQLAAESGVPVVNYGMAIAHMNGILDRALAPFS